MTPTYDVIIAGASFAGLAAAQRLRGRVLLLDKSPLGEGQTSACGAPLSIVEAMGAGASIQQVHESLVMHTPGRQASWALPEPFCTFDYRRFCEEAFARTPAEFLQTAVLGRGSAHAEPPGAAGLPMAVRTGSAEIWGQVLIDATGWRAVLAGGPRSAYVNPRWMAFGIETELPADVPSGLHFYFLPEVRDGYAWAFPCGDTVRFGVLSYLGRTKLQGALARFLDRFGLTAREIHGGYLASGLREPVVDGVFIAGDASGQCLPLTGEGIRTAVLAGFTCGELLQQVLDREISLDQAEIAYQEFTRRSRRQFRALTWANIALLVMPLRMTGAAAAYLSRPGLLRTFMRHYLGIFAPSPVFVR